MRVRAWIAGLVLGAAIAGGATHARADDRSFFAGLPSIRIGFGGGSGTTCDGEWCRDGGAISGVGSVGPSSGTGGWADLAVHFAAREVCVGFGCGGLPGTFALSGGVGRRDGRWYGAAGLGVAYSGASFARLWTYAHAVQATAVGGVALWRGRDLELSLEGRLMSSLAPFADVQMATLSVTIGTR
ncbi:MAG TPA: hypothetical protein VML75_14895 [Kofleriaceae bacterium]|nr:hypothetical protein [Kofleriaceae bacterium]